MYLNHELKLKRSSSHWLDHVANQLVRLLLDLKDCGCIDLAIYRGMTEKVFKEADIHSYQCVLTVQKAITITDNHPKYSEILPILKKLRY